MGPRRRWNRASLATKRRRARATPRTRISRGGEMRVCDECSVVSARWCGWWDAGYVSPCYPLAARGGFSIVFNIFAAYTIDMFLELTESDDDEGDDDQDEEGDDAQNVVGDDAQKKGSDDAESVG